MKTKKQRSYKCSKVFEDYIEFDTEHAENAERPEN